MPYPTRSIGRQLPAAIESLLAEALRLCTAELWAGFAQKKSGPGSPSPERVQGRLQQIFLSCSSRTLSSPLPFVNGTNDVRAGSDGLHAMCFAVPRRNEPYSPAGAKLTSRVTTHDLGCALPDLIRFNCCALTHLGLRGIRGPRSPEHLFEFGKHVHLQAACTPGIKSFVRFGSQQVHSCAAHCVVA